MAAQAVPSGFVLSAHDSLQEEKQALGLQVLDRHELSARFGGFMESCHILAKEFFFTQLPDSDGCDDLQDKLYQSGFTKMAPKSIPISSSLPSQYLRMAAAEKIIAQKLCTNIFRQYYLPETLADRQAMDSVLERLLRVNSRDEAIFRLQLLSAYKNEENRHIMSIVKYTIQEVVTVLGPLISPHLQGDFQSKLSKLLQEAVKLSSPVQRSAVRACVKMNQNMIGAYLKTTMSWWIPFRIRRSMSSFLPTLLTACFLEYQLATIQYVKVTHFGQVKAWWLLQVSSAVRQNLPFYCREG